MQQTTSTLTNEANNVRLYIIADDDHQCLEFLV